MRNRNDKEMMKPIKYIKDNNKLDRKQISNKTLRK